MLHDVFPVTRRPEWEGILNEPDDSERRRKLEAWLDRGHGQCWLRQPSVAELVEQTLLAEHRRLYALQAWALTPNHLAVVVDVWKAHLHLLLNKWKGATGRRRNRALG